MREITFKYSGFQTEPSSGGERYRVWCPNHFEVEFEMLNRVLVSWKSDMKTDCVGRAAFYLPDQLCVTGSAKHGDKFGEFEIRAELFLVSPDGFSALNITELRIGREEYFAAHQVLSLEVDVRGRASVECSAAQTFCIAGREYSCNAGRQEIEIAPLEIRREWFEKLAQKK